MTPELQKYYEDRFSMMATPGWRALMEDVHGMINATDTLSGVTDEKTLHFKRGELSIMKWLESLSMVSEQAYRGLHEDNERL
jgi:hypothetical protein